MEFQLSQFGPYKAAVVAKVAGDLSTARVEFRKCLEAGKVVGGAPMISGLLFRLGDVEALDGNRNLAIELYEEALLADPGSPLALISYAESAFTTLADPELALEKLGLAESLLASSWLQTEGDLSAEEYKYLIAKVRTEIGGTPT